MDTETIHKKALYKLILDIAEGTASSYYECFLDGYDENERQRFLNKDGQLNPLTLVDYYGDQISESINDLDCEMNLDFCNYDVLGRKVWDVIDKYFQYDEIEGIFYQTMYDYLESIYGKEYIDQIRRTYKLPNLSN